MTPGSVAEAPAYFADSGELRDWLRANHARAGELWVGLHKRGTGRPSITWPELVDQLLCFGWIDGVRRSLGPEAYVIRVTPRKPRSTWSAVNLRRAGELIEAGLMESPGREAYEGRDETRSERYSFEQNYIPLREELEAAIRADEAAWRYFQSQPPSYRKTAVWWVASAKREDTRRRRLETLVRDCAQGQRIAPMRR